jgi:gamma-glutamylcyclotransferase (GGCT)/AIG2-like uncharacterized protein YtfP
MATTQKTQKVLAAMKALRFGTEIEFTLKKGHHNHRVLAEATFVGRAEMHGYAMHSLGAFPAITPATSGERDALVLGEVYECPPHVMARLDLLEGCPHFYVRHVETLTDGSKAWVYYMPRRRLARHQPGPRITSGVWELPRYNEGVN